ncbi:MAG: beta strand repeat-containing protein [Phycisphaerales bacterium]
MRRPTQNPPHFSHLEARTLMAVIGFDGGPTGLGTSWNDPVNWAGDVLPGSADDAVIDSAGPGVVISANASVRTVSSMRPLLLGSGVFTIGSASTLAGRLTMSGGFLSGSGALTVGGGFDWTGGIIRTGGASGRITIPAGASMIISGAEPKLLARGIINSGLLELRGTNVFVDDENGNGVTAAFSNLLGATLRFDGDAFLDSTTPGTRTLTNAGVVEKTGGGQSGVGFTHNTGAGGRVQILSGTFGLGLGTTSGTVSVASGALLGIGAHTLANGSRIEGAGTAGTTEVTGFTVTGTATIAGQFFLHRTDIFGSGTLRIEGLVQSDGSILACTNIAIVAGGELLLQGGNGPNVLSTRLTNSGTLRLGQSNIQVETLSGQHITNNAGALMTLEGGSLALFNDLNPGSLPITNHGEVRVQAGGGSISARINLTNSATGVMNITSGLFLEGALANAGAINLTTSGAILTAGGALSGVGPISMSAGRVEIRSTAPLATLQAISASGGEVRIRSSGLDLAGGTLNLLTGAQWTLRGGTITNGTIITAPGVPFLVGAFDGFTVQSTLRQVTVTGDVALSDPSTILNWQNVTVSGETVLSGNGTSISFDGTQVVTSGTFRFPTTAGVHALRVRAGQTVTLEPGVLLHGRFSIDPEGTSPAGTLINRGIIRSNGGGGNQANIGNLILRNEGRLEAIESVLTVANLQGDAGTLLVTGTLSRISLTGTFTHSNSTQVGPGATLGFAGTWSNTGSVELVGGRWTIGGTFSLANLGTFSRTAPSIIDLNGTLNLGGGTLALNAATGSINLVGGQCVDGTITLTGGAAINISPSTQNRLNGIRLEGDLELNQQGATLRWLNTVVTGTVTLSANATILAFDGTQTVTSGRFVTTPSAQFVTRAIGIVGANTVTLAPGVVIESGGNFTLGASVLGSTVTRTLVNQGTILLSTALGGGQAPAIVPTTLTNQGTIETVGYTINYQGVTFSNYTPSTFTLSGGTWIARAAGAVLPASVNARVLLASITLDGANSNAGTLTQMSQLDGALALLGGRVLSVTPNTGTFLASGELTVSAGSRLSITGVARLMVGAAGPGPRIRIGLATGVAAGRISATGTLAFNGHITLDFASPIPIGARQQILTGATVDAHVSGLTILGTLGQVRPRLELGPAALTVYAPHAVDFDDNGLLSPDDLDTFITDFYDPDRRNLCDFNGDGTVNDLDLGAYIDASVNR